MPVVIHGGGDQGVVTLEEVAEREGLVGLRGADLRFGAEIALGEQLDGDEFPVLVFGMDAEGRGLAGGDGVRVAVDGDGDVRRGLVAAVLVIPADIIHDELVRQLRVLDPAVEGGLLAGFLRRGGSPVDGAHEELLRHGRDRRILVGEAHRFLPVDVEHLLQRAPAQSDGVPAAVFLRVNSGLPEDAGLLGHRAHVLLPRVEGADAAAVSLILEAEANRGVVSLADDVVQCGGTCRFELGFVEVLEDVEFLRVLEEVVAVIRQLVVADGADETPPSGLGRELGAGLDITEGVLEIPALETAVER